NAAGLDFEQAPNPSALRAAAAGTPLGVARRLGAGSAELRPLAPREQVPDECCGVLADDAFASGEPEPSGEPERRVERRVAVSVLDVEPCAGAREEADHVVVALQRGAMHGRTAAAVGRVHVEP